MTQQTTSKQGNNTLSTDGVNAGHSMKFTWALTSPAILQLLVLKSGYLLQNTDR